MTLWVTRDGQKIVIHGNVNLSVRMEHGQVHEWSVHEHYMHLKHFAGTLLEQIKEAEHEAEEAAKPAAEAEPGEFHHAEPHHPAPAAEPLGAEHFVTHDPHERPLDHVEPVEHQHPHGSGTGHGDPWSNPL